MTDRFGFHQACPDDDKSDRHLFEEGRQHATVLYERGGSNCVTNKSTGYSLVPPGGQHPTFRAQELRAFNNW